MSIRLLMKTLSSDLRQYIGLALIERGAKMCGLTIEQSCQDTANRDSWATVLATDTRAMQFVCANTLANMPGLMLTSKPSKRQEARVH